MSQIPMNQRWSMRGSNTHSRGGIGGLAQVERLGELSQAVAGELSLCPKSHSPKVKGPMLLGVRNPHPLTDSIHLPSPRRVETPVVHFDSPTGTFLLCMVVQG